jgi:hypothetical protein
VCSMFDDAGADPGRITKLRRYNLVQKDEQIDAAHEEKKTPAQRLADAIIDLVRDEM